MIEPLPDPRRYPASSPAAPAARSAAAPPAASQQAGAALVAAYRDALGRNATDEIDRSLAAAVCAAQLRRCWDALDAALAPPADAAVALRLFALPLLLVTGGAAGSQVAGAVPDMGRVRQVLEGAGALGPVRNFGIGNALCAVEALQALPLARLYALQRDPGAGGAEALALPPAEVRTGSDEEEVHLRFLVGAAVSAADAPSFVETGAAISTWGLALARELAEQLRVERLTLLPIPRPPATLLAAQRVGVIAREELALQAFVSRTLRRFRSEVGEPDVTLAALASGTLGLRFASPFVESRAAVHRRTLHPTETVVEAAAGLIGLLRECGIARVATLPEVVADEAFVRHPDAPLR
jgi:hypothetical protein